MPERLTYEFVKFHFEKRNYKLLSKTYINNNQKLEYICPNDHKHSITWHNFQNDHGCPYCTGQAKLTLEFVKKQFKKEGYSLLEKKYVSCETKMSYVCPNLHKHRITWHDWRQGNRCPHCSGVAKKNIDFIRHAFAEEGYVLLSNKYFGNNKKLKYICPKYHRHSITWTAWQQGSRCFYCSHIKPPTMSFLKEKFKDEGHTLLAETYKNCYQRLDCVCPVGHKYKISWNEWRRGSRCPVCARLRRFGPGNPCWKGGISKEPYCINWNSMLRDYIKERDSYRCMNPYCNLKSPDDLTIHHIDYNKKSCDRENLITLCRSCNSRANKNRGWHTAWYQAIMYRRYGYQYNNKTE